MISDFCVEEKFMTYYIDIIAYTRVIGLTNDQCISTTPEVDILLGNHWSLLVET